MRREKKKLSRWGEKVPPHVPPPTCGLHVDGIRWEGGNAVAGEGDGELASGTLLLEHQVLEGGTVTDRGKKKVPQAGRAAARDTETQKKGTDTQLTQDTQGTGHTRQRHKTSDTQDTRHTKDTESESGEECISIKADATSEGKGERTHIPWLSVVATKFFSPLGWPEWVVLRLQ